MDLLNFKFFSCDLMILTILFNSVISATQNPPPSAIQPQQNVPNTPNQAVQNGSSSQSAPAGNFFPLNSQSFPEARMRRENARKGIPQQTNTASGGIPQQTNRASAFIPQKTNTASTAIPPQTNTASTAIPPQTNTASTAIPQQTNPAATAIPPQTNTASTAIPPQTTTVSELDSGAQQCKDGNFFLSVASSPSALKAMSGEIQDINANPQAESKLKEEKHKWLKEKVENLSSQGIDFSENKNQEIAFEVLQDRTNAFLAIFEHILLSIGDSCEFITEHLQKNVPQNKQEDLKNVGEEKVDNQPEFVGSRSPFATDTSEKLPENPEKKEGTPKEKTVVEKTNAVHSALDSVISLIGDLKRQGIVSTNKLKQSAALKSDESIYSKISEQFQVPKGGAAQPPEKVKKDLPTDPSEQEGTTSKNTTEASDNAKSGLEEPQNISDTNSSNDRLDDIPGYKRPLIPSDASETQETTKEPKTDTSAASESAKAAALDERSEDIQTASSIDPPTESDSRTNPPVDLPNKQSFKNESSSPDLEQSQSTHLEDKD